MKWRLMQAKKINSTNTIIYINFDCVEYIAADANGKNVGQIT